MSSYAVQDDYDDQLAAAGMEGLNVNDSQFISQGQAPPGMFYGTDGNLYAYEAQHMYVTPSGYDEPSSDQTFDESDEQNQNEIDRMLDEFNGDDEIEDIDDAELEAQANAAGARSSYLPAGAVPSQGGKLSAHAAEFWFPECRNCPCCAGFKHGCACTKGSGVDTCKDSQCVNTDFVSQVNSTLAATSSSGSGSSSSARATAAPNQRSKPADSSRGSLPAGAVPSQGGKLSAHAAEFWFPECRNCPCCCGFKHGCACTKGSGVDTCRDAQCVNAEFVSQVNSTLASTARGQEFSSERTVKPSSPNARSVGTAGSVTGDICRFYAQGNCRFGAACRNRHPAANK